MAKLSVIDARHEHILPVACNLREEDLNEITAGSGRHPITAITEAVALSSHSWTLMAGRHPIAMFGVVPLNVMSGIGSPWLLGTSQIEKHKKGFCRLAIRFVKQISKSYPTLINYVDERNQTSKDWLEWLGFEILPPEPYGVSGLPFHRFELRR